MKVIVTLSCFCDLSLVWKMFLAEVGVVLEVDRTLVVVTVEVSVIKNAVISNSPFKLPHISLQFVKRIWYYNKITLSN